MDEIFKDLDSIPNESGIRDAMSDVMIDQGEGVVALAEEARAEISGLELRAIVEGLIFASHHAVSRKQIVELTGREEGEIEQILKDLLQTYQAEEHGFELVSVAHGYQFRTKAALKEIMAQLYAKKPARLTQAALEVLAIVAYKQPVTRPEMEKFRGVDCSSVLKALLDRELIEIEGRSDLPGNPVIYRTSAKFLEWFQIRSIEDLPPLAEFADMAEAREEDRDLIAGLTKDSGFQAEVAEIDDFLHDLGRNKGVEIPWEAKPEDESSEVDSPAEGVAPSEGPERQPSP